ncbi:MAG: sigma-70 family RNA polymerase sigma factor [Phycisphaerae bacterium]|jgi:RNA polymerase sigma-70 factor (ECF subfamily)
MNCVSPPNPDDSNELVARACAGDADALQTLLVREHARLRRLVDEAIGARYRRYVDAEDVLQDAYAALFAGGLSPQGDVSPAAFQRWVERVALNKLRDMQRALRRRRRDIDRNRHADTHGNLMAKLTSSGTTPSGAMAQEEMRAKVRIALARLSEAYREVIRLRIMEGRSPADVAERLGFSRPAVSMLLFRALKRLRAYVGKGPGPPAPDGQSAS